MSEYKYPGNLSGSELLEFWMRYYDLSPQTLADLAEVDVGKINRLLQGQARLMPEYVERILQALCLTIDIDEETPDANSDGAE